MYDGKLEKAVPESLCFTVVGGDNSNSSATFLDTGAFTYFHFQTGIAGDAQ